MKYKIPQYLHRQVQVLWFDLDELVTLNILFMLALIFGYFFWILLFVGPIVLSKLKKNKPRGYLKHMLYKLGIFSLKNAPHYFEDNFKE